MLLGNLCILRCRCDGFDWCCLRCFDGKEAYEMSRAFKFSSILAVLFLVFSAVLTGYGFTVYSKLWRMKYAKWHMRNAITATTPESIVEELDRTRLLLQVFPKVGNTDPIAHSPRNNLATAWRTLDEIIYYAETLENATGDEYRQGMDDTRARIATYLDRNEGRWTAFAGWIFWNGQGYWVLGWICSLLAFFLSWAFIQETVEYTGRPAYKLRAKKRFVAFLLFWIGLTALLILVNVFPIGYTGLT